MYLEKLWKYISVLRVLKIERISYAQNKLNNLTNAALWNKNINYLLSPKINQSTCNAAQHLKITKCTYLEQPAPAVSALGTAIRM
jgi:hypothetical protein